MAEWVGADPDLVEVKPNLDFTQIRIDPRLLKEFVEAKKAGAPVSDESIHTWMQETNLTRKTLEEEEAAIEEEEPEPEPTPVVVPVPGVPVEDEEDDEA